MEVPPGENQQVLNMKGAFRRGWVCMKERVSLKERVCLKERVSIKERVCM